MHLKMKIISINEGTLMAKDVKTMRLKELRELVKELFAYYGRDEVYEDEFFEYFKNKGFTEEEIDTLWLMVLGKSGLVKLGMHVEADDLPPKKIIRRVFIKLIK